MEPRLAARLWRGAGVGLAAQQPINGLNTELQVFFDVEVPEAQHDPSELLEGGIGHSVPLHVSSDLLVPVLARFSLAKCFWMAMPEGPVDEDCDPAATPGNVWATGETLYIEPVAAQSPLP